MKGYRSSNRLVMDLLGAIQTEGPVGVTRLLTVVNLTHAKLQDLLNRFESDGWVKEVRDGADRSRWVITPRGEHVLADLQRVDRVMQDHGLGL